MALCPPAALLRSKLRLLHVRKNIIYDHRGRVLVAVFRRNTPHNPLTAEQIKDVFDALTELRATHGFENIFKQDDSREWKSFHAGVWALCAFVFPKLSIRSAHALASYQQLSYLIKGTEQARSCAS